MMLFTFYDYDLTIFVQLSSYIKIAWLLSIMHFDLKMIYRLTTLRFIRNNTTDMEVS